MVADIKEYKLRFLLWILISASDSGSFDNISKETVKYHCANRTIDSFIKENLNNPQNLDILEAQDWEVITKEWESFQNAIDEKRKMGVESRGISLLLAYALESIQQRIER